VILSTNFSTTNWSQASILLLFLSEQISGLTFVVVSIGTDLRLHFCCCLYRNRSQASLLLCSLSEQYLLTSAVCRVLYFMAVVLFISILFTNINSTFLYSFLLVHFIMLLSTNFCGLSWFNARLVLDFLTKYCALTLTRLHWLLCSLLLSIGILATKYWKSI